MNDIDEEEYPLKHKQDLNETASTKEDKVIDIIEHAKALN